MDTEQLIRDVVKNVLEKLSEQNTGSWPSSLTDSSSKFSANSDIKGGKEQKDQKYRNNQENPESQAFQAAHTKHTEKKIVCGVSVRHIHLCRDHLDVLFGKGYILNVMRELYNPGYASRETLTIVGPKLTAIQNVRILGPLRSKTQVELAKTDCIVLGIDAPVRPSGETEASSSCVLVGPRGAVYLTEGVIRANRHLHMSPEDAEYYNIRDNQVVDIRVPGPKGLTFNNVQVRVAPDFKTEFHVDTDDGNAADIINGSLVEIVDASCISPISTQMAVGDAVPPSIPDGSFIGEVTDPNLLRNICAVATGQPCTQERISKAAATPGATADSSGQAATVYATAGSGEQSGNAPAAGLTKKILITVADLDNYVKSGICVTDNIILSPLARDEAIKRGIQISYD